MPAPDLWRTAVHGLVPALAEVPDAELLHRFHTSRDEAAFELLVYRHGPLVWAACRRMLPDHHMAEDAFQATFLALARQAGSIREGRSVPAWLHRVAVRAGIHLRRRNRRALLPLGDDVIDPRRDPAETAGDRETAAHIDAAINALSDRLRQVFILCELHGYSLADAAARLGVPIGTVASRLGRARERLRKALSARRLAVGSGLLTADVVPPAICGASVRIAAGGAKVTPMVMALSRQAGGPRVRMPMMGLACSLAAGFTAVAIALGNPEPPPSTPKPPAKESPPAVAVRTDAEGVPLPDSAVARLGSGRFRFGGTTDTTPFVPAAEFSPDGKLLAVGSGSGLTVLDVASGRPVHWFPAADRQDVQRIWFVADGRRLAVGATGPKSGLTIYDLATGKPAGAWALPGEGWLEIGDVTPDGSRVLYADAGGRVRLWDLATRAEAWSFPYRGVLGSALRITVNGEHVVLGDRNGKPELRDAKTGQPAAQFPDPGPGFNYWSQAASPDGRLAVAADAGEAIVVLAAHGADRLRRLASKQVTHSFAFSPDGRYLVGLGTQVWDLKEKDDKGPVARLPSARSAAFSADGKTLALAGEGVLTLWSVGDWKRRVEGPDPAVPVRRVWFTADGKHVLGYTPAGWLSWPAGGGPATRLSDDSPGHAEALADVSADGRVLADVLADPTGRDPRKAGGVRVIDRGTGEVRRLPLEGHNWDPVHVSPDGKYLSSQMPNQAIRVWDAGTGRVVFEEPRANDHVVLGYLAAVDGRGLALSLRGTWPRVTPTTPGESPSYAAVTLTGQRSGRTRALDPMPWAVYANGVRFTRDATRLVLHANYDNGRDGGSVSVWDVRTGRRLMNWKTKTDGYICVVAAAPDTRSVLVGDSRGTLTLVEVATGGDRAVFRHLGRIYSAAFAPDGTRAVASSPEAPVYVWNLLGDPGRWDPAKADAVWADLASPDAKVAYGSICNLRANPAEAVTFLKDRVKVPTLPADETVANWLKGLDAPAFADREKAQRELTAVAGLIRPKLEAARKTASAEAGRRLDQVLKALDEQVTPDGLREIRACEVLEGIRSPDAVRILKSWAGGPPGYRLTIEATESLERVNK